MNRKGMVIKMNYERRYKRLVADLLALMEKHIDDWKEADEGGFDIDEALDRANSTEPVEPVVYPKHRTNKNNRKNP